MFILKNYVGRGFLVTFAMAMMIITFVVSLSVIFKLTDLLAKDVSAAPLLAIIGTSIPMAVVFALPLAGLVASLLVFGRLSSDGEITAMKASGIGLGAVISTPLLFSVLMAMVSVYLQNELSPRAHYLQRYYISRMSADSIYKLFAEGRYITDWPGLSIYIGRRVDNRLKDIRVYDIREQGIKREIIARGGTVSTDTNTLDIVMELEGVTIKPFSKDIPDAAYCDRWPIRISKAMKKITYFATIKDMTLIDLIERIRNTGTYHPDLDERLLDVQRMNYMFHLNKRMSYAMSCIAFVLLGIPLGLRTHRKESSIGIVMSLGVVMVYHLLTLLAEYFVKVPGLRADIIVWVPIILAIFTGLYLLKKNE
jgi:lipopolysaccharide export system permease protein